MAALARNAFAAMQQRKAGVRILSEFFAYLSVTGLAGFRSDKIGGIGGACLLDVGLLLIWGRLLLIGCRLLLIGCRSIRRHGFPEAEQRYDERHAEEQPSHSSLRKGGLQSYSAYSFSGPTAVRLVGKYCECSVMTNTLPECISTSEILLGKKPLPYSDRSVRHVASA